MSWVQAGRSSCLSAPVSSLGRPWSRWPTRSHGTPGKLSCRGNWELGGGDAELVQLRSSVDQAAWFNLRTEAGRGLWPRGGTWRLPAFPQGFKGKTGHPGLPGPKVRACWLSEQVFLALLKA